MIHDPSMDTFYTATSLTVATSNEILGMAVRMSYDLHGLSAMVRK